ncbi:MAG: GTPase HflX [Chloroflexi bacterium]|nr:GTPase HflX [Chloroflexota bacterium]
MPNKKTIDTISLPEKVLLAAIQYKNKPQKWPISESLSELAELARSAGAEPLLSITQKLNKPSSTYLGKGKILEIKNKIAQNKIKTVIVDDELNPSQQKTLEDKLKVKVIDRTALIIDVFARRARSKEGKLQVDLAQNEYLLPRLAGQWSHLERLGGGIGTRGPGETQIETDRRLVRNKLSKIKNEIKKIQSQRRQQRALRQSNNKNSIALVGYTNAGKSAIFNRLTVGNVIEKNQLFSTLESTTRRLKINNQHTTISDTVGFVNKLPPVLVTAFKTTLEDASEATLLIHVIDISSRYAIERYQIVNDTLEDLNIHKTPRILLLNKVDLLPEKYETINFWLQTIKENYIEQKTVIVPTSALTGYGFSKLKKSILGKIKKGGTY